MIVRKEIKVSDRNYGNRTTSIEVEVSAENFTTVYNLLEQWADLVKNTVPVGDEDELTLKEAREYERSKSQMTAVLDTLASLSV